MSKLVEANKKIEDAVVGGYKKIEDAVVGSHKKVEEKFIDAFLKHDGETTEEARARVQKEHEEMREAQKQQLKDMPHYSKTTEEIQAEIKEKYGK